VTTLPLLVGRIEHLIRRRMPAASAFRWEGSIVGGRWVVTALDKARGDIGAFDLFLGGHKPGDPTPEVDPDRCTLRCFQSSTCPHPHA
jgi:hypothetical protein